MKQIAEIIGADIRTVGIAGHVNPDGDCVGSCTALWLYLKAYYPQIRVLDLYLERPKPDLCFLDGVREAHFDLEGHEGTSYDLFITCDVSEYNRIAVAQSLFDVAKHTVCIDHHISNPGFAECNHVEPEASSCAEVLAGLFAMEKVTPAIAQSLYTGIIHDSGVFQYQNTSAHTMRVAADLLEKGINFNRIIDDSFNRRTYTASRILGYALEKMEARLEGTCMTCSISMQEMERFGATKQDLDGIVAQMRLVKGTEAAVFAYEIEPSVYKVSLRSVNDLDVSRVGQTFGGGGHIRAAGCTLQGEAGEVLDQVVQAIAERLAGL